MKPPKAFFNNRNVFSRSSGGQRSERRASAGLVPRGRFSSVCRQPGRLLLWWVNWNISKRPSDACDTGFIFFALLTVWAGEFFGQGAAGFAGCLESSLPPTHQMPQAPVPPAVTIKLSPNSARCPLGAQNHPGNHCRNVS